MERAARAAELDLIGRLEQNEDARAIIGVVGRADDPGVIWSQDAHWHPQMPEPPKGFPGEASFAFTHDEADLPARPR